MKGKSQKGITLVALIITIIVLLILAVVAIRAVQGDGIIAHAKNARDSYNGAQISENGIIQNYIDYITGQLGESTTSGGPALSNIKIGDKVAYDEGYRADKKSDIDTNFTMDDMNWRVLDVDEVSGTVKLISSRPTTSKLTLSGEQGWLEAETKLDTLCSELYANGNGVTARSLKIEDIDKLANMLTPEARKEARSSYGSKWKYQYDATAKKVQYSKSTDNGETWTNYVDTSYDSFKEPEQTIIDSSNTSRIAELDYTYYDYTISSKITDKTSDNILISDLITKGLNDTNDASNDSNVTQWMSSRCVYCSYDFVDFGVCRVRNDSVVYYGLWRSYGYNESPQYAVRPVVSLPSSVLTTKVEGTWQVNL